MIPFYGTFKNQVKKSFSVVLLSPKNIKDSVKKVREDKRGKVGPAVSPDTTREEFLRRYNTVRVSMVVHLLFMALFIGLGVTFEAILAKVFSLTLTGALLLLYVNLSFTAWQARKIWADWGSRGSPPKFFMDEFIEEVCDGPMKLLPIKIKGQQ